MTEQQNLNLPPTLDEIVIGPMTQLENLVLLGAVSAVEALESIAKSKSGSIVDDTRVAAASALLSQAVVVLQSRRRQFGHYPQYRNILVDARAVQNFDHGIANEAEPAAASPAPEAPDDAL